MTAPNSANAWAGATQGGGFEQTYNALAGRTWSTGHALASVEYAHQERPITTGERDAHPGGRADQ